MLIENFDYADFEEVRELLETLELMANGNWEEAQRHFKAVNCSGRDFGDFMEELRDEELRDWALLGFYCRGYEPQKDFRYE